MTEHLRFAALLLAAAASAPAAAASEPAPARTVEIDGATYGPLTRFKGEHLTSFEHSSFDGCWFTNSPEFYEQFQRLGLPEPVYGFGTPVSYELEFLGRKTLRKPEEGMAGRYGHLGMFSCQIRAETLISARLLTSPETSRPTDP